MIGLLLTIASAGGQAEEPVYDIDIPSMNAAEALNRFAEQTGAIMLFPYDLASARQANAVHGRYTLLQGLELLLQDTGLSGGLSDRRVVSIAPVARADQSREEGDVGQNEKSLGQKIVAAIGAVIAAGGVSAQEEVDSATAEELRKGIPEIMVIGSRRTLNMDIERTEDDPQPYVVFDRAQIERSGATSLEQFLQQRLTMNTSIVNSGKNIGNSEIRLRGLSAAETLILIDGHRVSSPSFSSAGFGSLNQADITGIPLAAIERIEVLPATASGIYGGNATGGVINIIRRRDYAGGEVALTYDNTFSSDTAARKVDISFGRDFNEGKTNLLMSAHFSDSNDLLVGDRDFMQRGREAIWSNNSAFFKPPNIPPLGATPNIGSLDGSELVLDDGTQLNATFTSVPVGYAGPESDGGAALAENAGTYNWNLARTAQTDPTGSTGRSQALYTQPTVKSVSLSLAHQFNEGLQMFFDVSSSDTVNRFPTGGSSAISTHLIPAASPSNPFRQDIWVVAPLSGSDSKVTTTIEHNRALVGIVKRLSRNWQLGADYTWDRTTVAYGAGFAAPTFAGAVGAGIEDILRDTDAYPIDIKPYLIQSQRTSPFRSTMKDATVRISGPIGRIPGGTPKLSASVAYRNERVPDSFQFLPTTDRTIYYPHRSQSVTSGYLEILVPLFSETNARLGLRELELQVAVRRDDYTNRSGQQLTVFGALPSPLPDAMRSLNTFVSIDPTVAVRWKPWQDLTFRASYGTGFLPPALNQLTPAVLPFPLSTGTDPLRGDTLAGPFTFVTGGNEDLSPEQSENWSGGLIFAPSWLENVRLSVDYIRIEKADNIGTHPGFIQGLINDEDLFPGRIIRGPNLPTDPPDWAGPITVIDNSVLNLATAEIEAWDIQVDFSKETTRHGVFELFLTGTWQPHYKVQTLSGEPFIDHAGISHRQPLKFKGNAGVVWTRAGWRAGWNVSHFDSYLVDTNSSYLASQGDEGRVPSQNYSDVFVSYNFGAAGGDTRGPRQGIEVQVGIHNVFNEAPPLDVVGSSFYSPFGDPRMSSWYASVQAGF